MRSLIGRWLPVLVWMCVIFSASSDQLSFSRSSRIVGPLVRWLFPDVSDEAVHAIVIAARKCAHLLEYAVLALLFWRALRKPPTPGTPPWQWSQAALVLALVVLYAATDEFHQAFVPSREGSLRDLLVDALGGALGLLGLWVIGRVRRRW
ncbi:MAG TPA: VanZ family protein [Candidatus Paceibacterota bacterium]|nr:VanZ family protein [Candidatus Paceibacterota bacterium]